MVLKSNVLGRNTFPDYLSVWSSSDPGYSGSTVSIEQRDAARWPWPLATFFLVVNVLYEFSTLWEIVVVLFL